MLVQNPVIDIHFYLQTSQLFYTLIKSVKDLQSYLQWLQIDPISLLGERY